MNSYFLMGKTGKEDGINNAEAKQKIFATLKQIFGELCRWREIGQKRDLSPSEETESLITKFSSFVG